MTLPEEPHALQKKYELNGDYWRVGDHASRRQSQKQAALAGIMSGGISQAYQGPTWHFSKNHD
jgi:hypothetical protein